MYSQGNFFQKKCPEMHQRGTVLREKKVKGGMTMLKWRSQWEARTRITFTKTAIYQKVLVLVLHWEFMARSLSRSPLCAWGNSQWLSSTRPATVSTRRRGQSTWLLCCRETEPRWMFSRGWSPRRLGTSPRPLSLLWLNECGGITCEINPFAIYSIFYIISGDQCVLHAC